MTVRGRNSKSVAAAN